MRRRFTSYVASRLQTFRTKGTDNVRTLLSFMCIPLKQAQAAYGGSHAHKPIGGGHSEVWLASSALATFNDTAMDMGGCCT